MNIRFFIDPDTDRPHIENHGVTMDEAAEILESFMESFAGQSGATITVGRTSGGRYLKVVHKPDEFGESPDDIWVITAYPIRGNELKALRRRTRRRS